MVHARYYPTDTGKRRSQKVPDSETAPPLQAGDRLSRFEFERRYRQMPDIKKAELVEGVVYMPSPVRFGSHGEPHAFIMGWLGLYRSLTPGGGKTHIAVGEMYPQKPTKLSVRLFVKETSNRDIEERLCIFKLRRLLIL